MGRFVSIYSHVLILLVHVQMLLALFLNECPDKLMWTLRAKQLCGVEDKYMCLYDTNKRSFRELCKDAPEFHRPGNIFVISGNLKYFAGRQCYSNRYQPHKWWTNGSSECQYIKSSCNGEGQVPYDNGTITRDKKCRCDYTNYYTFVSITRNKCHCDPIEEDCSCYRQRCHEDQVLTPDYDCVSIHEWTGRFICPEYKPPIINDEKHGATLCPTIEKDSYGKINLSSFRIVVSLLSGVFVIFGLVTFTFFKLRKTLKDDMQDYTETFLRDTVGKLPLIDYFLEEPSNIECIEGEDATLTCKVRLGSTSVKWFKDGNEIKQNEYYIMSNEQKNKIQLTLKNTKRSDSGVYIVHVGKDSRKVQLTIKGFFLKEPSDIKCIEGEDATLTFEVRPGSKHVKWFKDGIEIKQNEHYKMSIEGIQHKLELKLTLKATKSSDSGEYIVQVRNLSRKVQLTIKDLAETINQLSEEDKSRYKKLMQSSETEKRYSVRTIIVGKESVGKTCLMRRLLKEDISDVTSTDGIDIVVRRCKINIEDGQWIIGKEINDDKISRIKRALNPCTEDRGTSNMQQDSTRNINKGQHDEMSTYKTDATSNEKVSQDKSEDTNESSLLVLPEDFTTVTEVNMDNYKERNEPLSLVMPEDLIYNMFSRSTENTFSNNYALCALWDFAGQKEFYATHQAFLTSSAVYLVVADMKDDICKQGFGQFIADYHHIGEYVDFWFDSIHCLRTTDETTSYGNYNPPIVLVFTGKDKYDKADFKKRQKELYHQLTLVLGCKSKYHHLHKTFYMSNSKDSDEEFEKLQYAIYEVASTIENWGKPFPLKWILLEHLIDINKNDGKNFITFTGMSKLAKHPEINILEEDELLLFLRFQHNVGNIIFFANIRDLIILNPQWLADAFRCLVSDRFDNSRLRNLEDWMLFVRQGKISESLITELFKSKGGSQFSGQICNLHKVMEKLDILIKIENSSYYIMPSQMPSSTFDVLCETFGILDGKCKRTSWLCFKFDFLPPSFFNHVSAWFIRHFNPCQVCSSVALYRGICMFDIDGSGCTKILVTMSTDTIALQVVSFSEQEGFGNTCSDIYRKVDQLIKDITERYKVKISSKLHFKCSNGDYYRDTFEYESLTTHQECYCPQHMTAHRSEQLYSLWMKSEAERVPDRVKISTKQDDHNPESIPHKVKE